MGQLLPYKGGYYLWQYVPSVAGAIILLLAFLAITSAHAWYLYKRRLWFCIPFVIGGVFEVVGYGGRAASSNATNELGPYVIQSTLLLVAPALYAASVYMVLGRVIRSLPSGPPCSPVPPRWLTKVFVGGDCFSFLLQGSGAGLMVESGMMGTGQHIIIGGLVVQVIMFGLFVFSAVVFHTRARSRGIVEGAYGNGSSSGGLGRPTSWQTTLGMLYAVSALIMLRSVFRVVEYVMGRSGYPLTHEWTLYVFDSVPMLSVMVIYFVWYPPPMPAPGQPASSSEEAEGVECAPMRHGPNVYMEV